VIFRFFVYALCVYAARGRLATKGMRLSAFLLMVVPHVLLHLPEQFLINPLNGVISAIFMSLLFGLPMALLQLKRGLEAAIALHWFVDFIRFFILGS